MNKTPLAPLMMSYLQRELAAFIHGLSAPDFLDQVFAFGAIAMNSIVLIVVIGQKFASLVPRKKSLSV
jgi:hypothetical protein